MSSIVNVAVEVTVLPKISVAVNVTVAAPVSPQRSDRLVKSFVQVTAKQLSLTVAPPLEVNQSFSSEVFPEPSHSTVRSAAFVNRTGAPLGFAVNVH